MATQLQVLIHCHIFKLFLLIAFTNKPQLITKIFSKNTVHTSDYAMQNNC